MVGRQTEEDGVAGSIQELFDRQALADLVASYSRAIDRRDFAVVESLYHPDGLHDHGAMFQGSPREFADWLRASMRDIVTQHFVGNTLFEIDGDRAQGEAYTINVHVIGGARDYVAGGRYLDHYVRAGERWLFWSRKRVLDWTYEGPSAPAATGAGVHLGSAGPGDPSYAALSGLFARRGT